MGECHRNKRKSSSASVFFGDYREKWEDMSEHSAITPCANHLTSQQFPCSDASWLQHSPRPSSGGAFAQMMDLYVIKPLKTSKKLWPCIENSLDPAQLSSHCCSEMLKYSPSFVAAPAAGRRSLTLGCIWPVPQSCWQWILFFLLWVLFCFLSPRAAISSYYNNWHCLCSKRNSPSQFWWKNVEEGILFGESGCIKEK